MDQKEKNLVIPWFIATDMPLSSAFNYCTGTAQWLTDKSVVKQMLPLMWLLVCLTVKRHICPRSPPFLLYINTAFEFSRTYLVASVCSAHLNFLAVYLDQPLPEVHADRGLGFLGELPGTEAVGEAGLPDPRVPDHDDFEDAGPRRQKGRARQRAGEFNRRAAFRHITTTGWMISRGSLLQQQSAKLPLLLSDERSRWNASDQLLLLVKILTYVWVIRNIDSAVRYCQCTCDLLSLNKCILVNTPSVSPQLWSHVQCWPFSRDKLMERFFLPVGKNGLDQNFFLFFFLQTQSCLCYKTSQ